MPGSDKNGVCFCNCNIVLSKCDIFRARGSIVRNFTYVNHLIKHCQFLNFSSAVIPELVYKIISTIFYNMKLRIKTKKSM